MGHILHHSVRLHTATTTALPPQSTRLATKIVTSSDERVLTRILHSPAIRWTPLLVNSTLKHLWNHPSKALQFFHLLSYHPTYGHHVSSFEHAIDISGRQHDFCSVWRLISLMRSRGFLPTSKTFALIFERYAAAKKPHRSLKVFLSMHEHGCPQDLVSLNILLDVLCKSKHVQMAYNLLKIFKTMFRVDSITYNTIANGWCLIKNISRAQEVVREMVDRGLNPNMTTYNIILKGYFRIGRIDAGWDFFREMKKKNLEIDTVTYTTLIHGLGVAGETKRAQKLFDEMQKKGIKPSVETYNALIQILCKKDNVENAMLVFDELRHKSCAPNTLTCNLVIRGLCHVGQMDRAMEFMGRMRELDCRPNIQTHNLMIRYLCEAGKSEKAVELFLGMREGACLPNLDTYNTLISAMFARKKGGNMILAGKLLIEMVDKGFMPRRFTFNRVLNGLMLTGNQDFAREILKLPSKNRRLFRLKL